MTAMGRWLTIVPATALLLAMACAADERLQVEVGDYTVRIDIPDGWEHLDYGREHHFRRGTDRISLEFAGTGAMIPERVPDATLERLGVDERHSVKSRRVVERDGREFIVIDTWDKLSHQFPRRFVMTLDGGAALILFTRMGSFETMEAAVDAIFSSLEVVSAPVAPADSLLLRE